MLTQSSVETFWSSNTRPDGRLFHEARRLTVQQSILTKNAIGSSLVRMASTVVLAAVSYQVGQPIALGDGGGVGTSSTAVSQGDINVQFSDDRKYNILQSYLERLLRETMDLKQLSIEAGQSAFCLTITLHVLNLDGNLTDAAMLACVAALQDVTLPALQTLATTTTGMSGSSNSSRVWLKTNNEMEETVTADSFPERRLEMSIVPVPLSMGVMLCPFTSDGNDSAEKGGKSPSPRVFLVDPTADEQDVLEESYVTIVVDMLQPKHVLSLEMRRCGGSNNNNNEGLSYSSSSLSQRDLAMAGELAAGRAKELQSILL